MSSEETLPVALTWWRDQTQTWFMGSLWTVTDSWNTVISLFIGILFGLIQPSIERIVSHLLAWVCYKLPKSRRTLEIEAPEEERPLLNDTSSYRRRYCGPLAAWITRSSAAKSISLIVVVAFIAAGTFITRFSSEGAALSASKICGAWGLKEDANSVAQDEDALIQGERETRAGLYARDCYGSASNSGLNRCSVFKEQALPIPPHTTGHLCPFEEDKYCPGDQDTGVRFTTGQVPATAIGINQNVAPTFNRTTVCTPLDVDAGFVHHLESRGAWGYDLGPVDGDEHRSAYTFEQPSDPWDYDVRSYTMSTYVHVYGKADAQNYWKPAPELSIRPDLNARSQPYSITVMFINSCHFYYKDRSNDWIFPAQELAPNSTLYWNRDSRARPLACIDWIEICRNSSSCTAPAVDDPDAEVAYDFTRFALNKSTTFHAIEFRGATGLDAQYKIQDYVSLPLSSEPPQWVVESEQLFQTSLARVQYDAMEIANGTQRDGGDRYVQKMPARTWGKVCGMFTFQPPKGYDNIRLWPTFLFGILLPLVVFLMAIETKEEFSDEKKNSGWFKDMKLMWAEKIWRDTKNRWASPMTASLRAISNKITQWFRHLRSKLLRNVDAEGDPQDRENDTGAGSDRRLSAIRGSQS